MSEASMYRVIAGYMEKLPGAVKEGERLYSTHSLRATTATLLLVPVWISARSRNYWAIAMSPLPRSTTSGGARRRKARLMTCQSNLSIDFSVLIEFVRVDDFSID